jgi:repressor LexA
MRAAGEAMRQRIIRGINDLTRQNNRPPTNRELGDYLGGKSTGHIDYHLRILREQGAISHDPKKSRGIRLLMPDGAVPEAAPVRLLRIPLIGRIAAGAPIEAIQSEDEYVDIAGVAPNSDEVYALRVKGKSMIEDLIDDNDIVVIRRQETAHDGDTVVALLTNGSTDSWEATLKRFYREKDGKIRLQPANSTMSPLIVPERDVRIQGKVISVIRTV